MALDLHVVLFEPEIPQNGQHRLYLCVHRCNAAR